MSRENITLFLAVWGAMTGTVAVFINFFAFFRDRSRLKVTASMAYGSSRDHGRRLRPFFTVCLTNRGRRIIRIHSIAIRTHAPLDVALNRFLFRKGWAKRAIGGEIGIYTADIDPIKEFVSRPDTKKYPPGDIALQEHQTVKVELDVMEEILPLIPTRRGTLIVTDQIGVKHKAHYLPIHPREKETSNDEAGSTHNTKRLSQIVLIVTFVGFSWLAMQAVHELGHVLGGVASGGTIEKVVLHPCTLSRTDVSPNPHPLFEVWSGAAVGAILPLVVFLLAAKLRCPGLYLFRFFAGFCLIANGVYIGVGSFQRIADAGQLLVFGSPQWMLILFGLATAPLGLYLWNGIGSHFGLGEARGKVSRAATVVSLSLFAAVVAAEMLVGSR